MFEQLMNYQNNCLCDMLPPYGPITEVDLVARVTLIVGVTAAIIVAGILVKMAEKNNSVTQEEQEKQEQQKQHEH